MATTKLTGVLIKSGSIPTTALGGGVISSSVQLAATLPTGTVSSSAQYPGWVTSSTQIDYNSIQNKLSGTISSSTQFNALTNTSASYAVTASYVPGAVSDWNSLTNKPTDLVSSSVQVKAFLPGGTVSSSAQYPGWVTSSTQIVWSSVSYSSGIVSSSAQVKPLLPDGTVSSSAQYPGWVTSSTQIVWSSINYNSGIVSSSAQVKPLLPGGTVTSSAQYPGWVTSSTQIDYNSITNKLSGVVSSSTQVKPLLPDGTISSSTQVNAILDADGVFSSSAQVQLASITGTTFAAANFTFPQNLIVAGALTAQEFYTELVSASVIFESGSTKFGNTTDDTMSVTGSIRVLGGNISGSFIGLVSSSAQIDYNSIQNKLSGVVSSSTQVQPLLPAGTVSSSTQYPGWVTSSTQIVWSSVNYNSGIVSSSAQVVPLLPANTISSSTQFRTITDPFTGSFTGSFAGTHTGTFPYSSLTGTPSGIVSSSTQVAPLLPGGTVSSSAQYPGWVTASSQINFTQIQNIAGIVSSSTQFRTITNPFTGSFTGSFAGTHTGTFPYNNLTGIPANIVSSSTQVQTLLPGGTVSSSAQYPGWVTASSQINFTQIQNTANIVSSSTQFTSLTAPFTGSFTGSLVGSLTGTSSRATSASYADAFSGFINFPSGLVVTGSTLLSGSAGALRVSGSATFANGASGSFTGSFTGNGSGLTNVSSTPPAGTVSSSAQYPGWVTASSQIDYNSITNKLSGVYSSSAFTTVNQGTLRLSFNGNALADVDTGLQTSDSPTFSGLTSTGTVLLQGIYSSSAQTVSALSGQRIDISGSQFTGIVSGSGLAYRLVVPVGTNYYAT